MCSIRHFMTDDSALAHGGCVALQPYRQVDVMVGQNTGSCQQLFGSQESRLTFVSPKPALVSCSSVGHATGSGLSSDESVVLQHP